MSLSHIVKPQILVSVRGTDLVQAFFDLYAEPPPTWPLSTYPISFALNAVEITLNMFVVASR